MERKKDNKEVKMFWKRTLGSYKHNGVRYKENEVFEADASEIPKGAMDVIKRCNEDGTVWVKPPLKGEAAKDKEYTKVARGLSKTWWDVFDENGIMMNPRGIYVKDADELIKQLYKQTEEDED